MANQYSPRHFFRQTPNKYLQAYFEAKKVIFNVEFEALKENDVEALFNAFRALPDDERTQAESDFRTVHSLAKEGGIQALVDGARDFNDIYFIEQVASIEGFHAKALWAFINKPEYWRVATLFLHADNVSTYYWKKRNGLPLKGVIEDAEINNLSQAISAYFYTQEARGKRCKVETYQRDKKEYFFAYPEDYAQANIEWVSNRLENRPAHPAFEIIFVYCQDEQSLDIYAPKNTKKVLELQKLFAKHILQLDTLPDGEIDNRVYELDAVGDRTFDFKLTPDLGIESVVVTRLRLSFKQGNKARVTLEADTKHSAFAVYDLLDKLNPPSHFINQIGLKVTFLPIGFERPKTKKFNITYPNSCALNYDGNDLKIRNMLVASELEPHPPSSDD